MRVPVLNRLAVLHMDSPTLSERTVWLMFCGCVRTESWQNMENSDMDLSESATREKCGPPEEKGLEGLEIGD